MIKQLSAHNHIIIQIDNNTEIYPSNVISLKIPKIFSYKALRFYSYNFLLRKKIKALINQGLIDPNNDVFLCHYAFHYKVVEKFRNVIILSHGVEWDGPGTILKKLYHLHRKSINQTVFKNSNIFLVGNDVNYFKQLGYTNTSSKDYFNQIEKNKWLLPNCIDTFRYKKLNSFNPLFPENTIIIPRNIVPQRGMDVVIQSFSKLITFSNFSDYKLYIVGEKYDKQYFNSLVDLVQNLNLNNRVIFYGSVLNEQTPLVYNSAKLTIIFSLFREGTSLAALESMACGTPVITSNIGGLKELPTIKAEKSDLVEIIKNTIENHNSISERQYNYVEQNHSITKWTKTWEDIIYKVINK
jgi:glycosyltransferase involved in cell wall biosynthesis